MTDPSKCAHPACKCPVPNARPFGDYCSEHCKEAAGMSELRCDCKHPTCR
jgi:hypothetical protein